MAIWEREDHQLFREPYFQKNVSECIFARLYDGDWTRHPYEEESVPRYTAHEPDKKYSWIKAPRFDGHPRQVGPLAGPDWLLPRATSQRWAGRRKALTTAGNWPASS